MNKKKLYIWLAIAGILLFVGVIMTPKISDLPNLDKFGLVFLLSGFGLAGIVGGYFIAFDDFTRKYYPPAPKGSPSNLKQD